jgi:hypothetical protein
MRSSNLESDEYSIDLRQRGRGGWITYAEHGRSLKFPVESGGLPGLTIFVPRESRWNADCERQQASWAKDRRQEILDRIARRTLMEHYPNGSFEVTDQWIRLSRGPSLAERLLSLLA